jgi:hypothetical protein
MLGGLEPQYDAKLARETKRVLTVPNASPEDLRWVEFYDPSLRTNAISPSRKS